MDQELFEELYRRHAGGTASGWRNVLRYWRKRYAWVTVVGGARFLKRATDVVFSLVALMALSPLFAVLWVLIKRDGGPLFFWQKRVGQYGREFPFPKFRSMVVNAEALKDKLLEQSDHVRAVVDNVEAPKDKPPEQGPRDKRTITFKMKDDPRITRVGRWIRRASIDEMPQFWCVLKGDMSLVGPRPPVPREVELYTLADRRRLDVKPGLTCIWQVSGRGDIPFDQQVQLDAKYIESQSLWVDLKLLFWTVPAVLFGKGAY
jgi:lipopolysaccharide/colanic/teichoic acid biosynthesis glycosyltransferase